MWVCSGEDGRVMDRVASGGEGGDGGRGGGGGGRGVERVVGVLHSAPAKAINFISPPGFCLPCLL